METSDSKSSKEPTLEMIQQRLQTNEAKRARALLETAMGSLQAHKLIKQLEVVKLIKELNQGLSKK